MSTRRIGLVVVLLVVVAAAAPFAQAAAEAEEWAAAVAEAAGHAVVTVVASTEGREETSQGSGFLVSADGLAVTNYHVIQGSTDAIVRLDNGSLLTVEGVVRKSLPLTQQDLVVLKCEGRKLPFLGLAAGDKVNAGQAVAAMGTPMGLEATLSTGIVSAVRDLGDGVRVLQTTAPISQGSSGGPLLNREGKVIGVTSAFLSGGQNLNFAVAAGPLRTILSSLDAAAKEDVVALGDVPAALAGKGAKGGEAANAAWEEPTDGLDVSMRLMALDLASTAATERNRLGLSSLDSIDVVTEEVDSAAALAGVTTGYLDSYIESALRKDGALKPSEEVEPYLHVVLTALSTSEGWVAYNLSISLMRPALLAAVAPDLGPGGKPVSVPARVWERGEVAHCPVAELQREVTGSLDRWLVELLNDVRKMNPKTGEPAQERNGK